MVSCVSMCDHSWTSPSEPPARSAWMYPVCDGMWQVALCLPPPLLLGGRERPSSGCHGYRQSGMAGELCSPPASRVRDCELILFILPSRRLEMEAIRLTDVMHNGVTFQTCRDSAGSQSAPVNLNYVTGFAFVASVLTPKSLFSSRRHIWRYTALHIISHREKGTLVLKFQFHVAATSL